MSTTGRALEAQLSINDILRHNPATVAAMNAYRTEHCTRCREFLVDAAGESKAEPKNVSDEVVGETGDKPSDSCDVGGGIPGCTCQRG